MSTMYVNNIAPLEGNMINVASGHTLYAPGSVVQVVEGSYDTQTDISTTSYADSGLSVTITPKSSSSKILAITNIQGYINGTGQLGFAIVRGSTQIVEASKAISFVDNNAAVVTLTKLDEPNTTNAVTYKVQMKKTSATGTMRINQQDGGSRITLMEIAQ
jgi:hypothetical protein